MGFISAIRKWWGGIINKNSIYDVFGVEVALSPLMEQQQELYRQIVRGHAPWNDVNIPNLRLANAVSSECANKIIDGLESNIIGGIRSNKQNTTEELKNPRSEYLNEQYASFKEKWRNAVIAACNGGEIILKPFIIDGNIDVIISETECYWPIAYNTRNELIDVIFGAAIQRERKIYHLLERHTFNETVQTHQITYLAFESSDSAFSRDDLGKPIPVTSVPEWEHLADVTINHIEQPLFVHFRIPSNDTIETPQRQGLPIWSKAIQKLQEADTQNAYIRREYYLGKARILASIDLFGVSGNPNPKGKTDGRKPLEFAPDDQDIFVKLNEDPENVPITIFAPDFRYDGLSAEMNRIKRDIELLSGLSYGIISDVNNQDKTAEEVRWSKDRFATTINILTDAFHNANISLAYSFNVLADIQGIPLGDYELTWETGDSILVDRTKEFDERMKLVSLGVISLAELRAWYMGTSVDAAQDDINIMPKIESEF